MNLRQYQITARSFAIYPNMGFNPTYPTLGLCGESGEVAEKMKKVMRDHNGVISEEGRQELGKELGDVLWYIANLASELDYGLDEIAEMNIEKLSSRQQRNKLQGEGDNR